MIVEGMCKAGRIEKSRTIHIVEERNEFNQKFVSVSVWRTVLRENWLVGLTHTDFF